MGRVVSMSGKIAYLINEYPKVSHSFIRREILALERRGFEILRVAIRGWDSSVEDPGDVKERERTRYLMCGGVVALFCALIRAFLRTPARTLSAMVLAIRMSHRAERPLPYHLAYLAEACRLRDWLRSSGVSHLHAHFGTNSAEVAMLVHTLGGPSYSFTAHGTEVSDKPEFLGLGEKIRRAAFVVAVSSYGRAQLLRWSEHRQWPKVKVVRCGIEHEYFEGEARPAASGSRLLCVGRLCNEKGQQLLVDVVSQLIQRGMDLELVLAGDGEMRGVLEDLIALHGLGRRVRITGWISSEQVREEILAARALVLPSFAEGLPVVLVEAMALRRPVVATSVGGIPELVVPGENGWLVPAGCADSLAAALSDVLGRTSRDLERMGEAARRRALAMHSVDVEAGKLGDLFRAAAQAQVAQVAQ